MARRRRRTGPGDSYELVWMDVRQLAGINLLPTVIRDQLAAAV